MHSSSVSPFGINSVSTCERNHVLFAYWLVSGNLGNSLDRVSCSVIELRRATPALLRARRYVPGV